MRTTATILIAALLVAGAECCRAQEYQDGWFLTGRVGPRLLHVDNAGSVTTILGANALPSSAEAVSMTMNADNDSVLVCYWAPANGDTGLAVVDRIGTIRATWNANGRGPVWGVALDQDGNYIVCVATGPAGPALLRLDPTSRVTTLATGDLLREPSAVLVDATSGDYLVALRGTSPRLVRVPRAGGTPVALTSFPMQPGYQISQGLTRGDVYVTTGGASTQPANVMIVRNGAYLGNIFGTSSGFGNTAVHVGRSSDRFVKGAFASERGGGITWLSSHPFRSGIQRGIASIAGFSTTHVIPDRSRTVSTARSGPSQWAVALHYPADARLSYLLALSLLPPSPSQPLSDLRRLAFRPDSLTLATLAGAFDSLIRQRTGVLDGSGRAAATIDVRAIAQVASGVTVWIQAITLDPAAPLGIRTIFEPVPLVL